MNWRKQLTPNFLPDLVRMGCWMLTARERSRRERTWPIGRAELASVSIGWPTGYPNPETPRFVEFLEGDFQRKVKWENRPIPQPYPGILLFDLEVQGKAYRHAVDVGDLDHLNEEAVRSCDLYFKYQFAEKGYAWENVIPGGYVPKDPSLYSYLPHLRKLRDRERNRHDVHGRFSRRVATEIRTKAHALLSEQKSFRYEGGLVKSSYIRFLQEAARSRICIDLPGYGAFCYRLVDNLAIGSCIVGPAPRNRFPVPLKDRVHMVFCKRDLSDLVTLCEYYLEHDEERRRLVEGSRDYFDRYLHRDQISDYYLSCCLDYHRLRSGASGRRDGAAAGAPIS